MATKPLTAEQAAGNLDTATRRYRARYLAGYALPDVVRRSAETASPELKLSRAGLESRYADPKYTDPNSETYITPETRMALVRQQQQGGREHLSRVTDAASRLFDRELQTSRFGIEDAQAAYQPFIDEQKRRQELEDYLTKQQISARFRGSTKAPPYSTFADARKDPLGYFLANYGTRRPDTSGGFEFLDAQGNPITVEQAAGMVPGASRADFLKGSFNPQDAAALGNEPDVDKYGDFDVDLQAGVDAVRTGAKKKDVRARLLGQYPTYGSAIDAALGFK
uniref:Uncharacterized protein n=1 Tax=Eiseniibacteriota bacterium TaxID=2212470 RepID=A0A832I3R0_UNCEI